LDALGDSDLIIHAGDIGDVEILRALEKLAPVVAVRGNMDREPWTKDLPRTQVVEIGQVLIYILHDLLTMDLNPKTAGFNLVISGHTHSPEIVEMDGVCFLNPGSAGSKKFGKLLSLARVELVGGRLNAEIVLLET
jgi:putative phosphoesterase